MMKRCTMVALTAALTAPVSAQNWRDDFEDGSATDGTPVTWTASPAFPSEFEVIDGDLVLTMPDGAPQPITSARVPINFADGASIRARNVGLNGPGRYAIAIADEPTGIYGYVAAFTTCNGGRIELFRGDAPGVIVFLGAVPWPYGPLEEHYIQLDMFDGVLSARVWRPGEPFPAPQITAVDTRYSEGVVSVAIQDFGGGTSGCQSSGDFTDVSAIARFVQASSTPLTHSGAGDATADGLVDVADLLAVLGAWGDCPVDACPADLNRDGVVNVSDLLIVIVDWS